MFYISFRANAGRNTKSIVTGIFLLLLTLVIIRFVQSQAHGGHHARKRLFCVHTNARRPGGGERRVRSTICNEKISFFFNPFTRTFYPRRRRFHNPCTYVCTPPADRLCSIIIVSAENAPTHADVFVCFIFYVKTNRNTHRPTTERFRWYRRRRVPAIKKKR